VRNRNLIPLLIFLAGAAAVAFAWVLFAMTEQGRYDATLKVAHSRSVIKLGMSIHHATGPISDETYLMNDIDGASSSEYRAIGRTGTTIKVNALPHQTVDVAFFFDRTVSDGIWELASRPVRGDADTRYTVSIYQMTNGQHGSHSFTFTDPHYWATTGGHQYRIHLDKKKPVPDLLTMSSTIVVEPRYERLVNDFLGFGATSFRAKIAAARAKLSGAKS
jgi:hypothetical protein